MTRPTNRTIRVRNGSSRWIMAIRLDGSGLLVEGRVAHDLFLGGAAGQFAGDAALPHHQDAVGHLRQLGHLGTDHQDGGAGARQFDPSLRRPRLCAHVDAARGLVEQEHPRSAEQPLRDHDFLLIAAAQPARRAARAIACGCAGGRHSCCADALLFAEIQKAEAADGPAVGERRLQAIGRRSREAGVLAVFGDQRDARRAPLRAGMRMAGFPAATGDLARVDRVDAEEGAAEFGAARRRSVPPARRSRRRAARS